MKRLPKKFTKHRCQFEQLCRTESTAIYVQHRNGREKVFEVVIIRVATRKPIKSGGKVKWAVCEPYECYPSNDAWGTCGFTFATEEEARAKYDLLNDPAFQLPAPPLYPIRPRARDGIVAECI